MKDNPFQRKEKPTLAYFTCFPNLPIELQLIIWSMTVEPRIIPVVHHRPKKYRHKKSRPLTTLNKSKPPACLSVNRASRSEVLKCYQLWMTKDSEIPRSPSHGFYINPLMDTLFFGKGWEFSLPSGRPVPRYVAPDFSYELRKTFEADDNAPIKPIRHIALDARLVEKIFDSPRYLVPLHFCMSGLEDLTVIVDSKLAPSPEEILLYSAEPMIAGPMAAMPDAASIVVFDTELEVQQHLRPGKVCELELAIAVTDISKYVKNKRVMVNKGVVPSQLLLDIMTEVRQDTRDAEHARSGDH